MNTNEELKLHPALTDHAIDRGNLSGGGLESHELLVTPGRQEGGGRKSLFSRLSLSNSSTNSPPLTSILRASKHKPLSTHSRTESSSSTGDDLEDEGDTASHDDEPKVKTTENVDSADEEIEQSDDNEGRKGTLIRRSRPRQLSKGRRHQRISRSARSVVKVGGDAESFEQSDHQSGDSDDAEPADNVTRDGTREDRRQRSKRLSTGPRRKRTSRIARVDSSIDASAHSTQSESNE